MTTEISIIEQAKTELPNAPAVIAKNQSYLTVYQKSAEKLKTKAEAELTEAGRLTEATDLELNKWQVSAKLAINAANEARTPITQLLTKIAKSFTSIEAEFDTLYKSIQAPRDRSAKAIAVENARIAAEAQAKLDKAKERVDLDATIEIQLRTKYAIELEADKTYLKNTLNNLTLSDIDQAQSVIEVLTPQFKLDRWVISNPIPRFHTEIEVAEMVKALQELRYETVAEHYSRVMEATKTDVINTLPLKKFDLQEFAKAGLEEQNRITKLAKDKAAKDKADKEIAAEQEAANIAEQVERNKEIAAEKVNDQHAMTVMSATKSAPVLKSYTINVTGKLGWKEIANFWFTHGAPEEDLESFGKKSLSQMKTFAEKFAHKNGVKIESSNLVYEEEVKAVASAKLTKAA